MSHPRLAPENKSNPLSSSRYSLLNNNNADLAEADRCLIWGKPGQLESLLEENRNPSLLTDRISGEDHRGPGVIRPGTLFQRALYVGEAFIKNARQKETVVGMLARLVTERCGMEEFERQKVRACEVMEEERKKKEALEAGDIKALNEVWAILTETDEAKLENNKTLETALEKFAAQLRETGNEKIIQEAINLYDKNYFEFGGYNSNKNNFALNKIIGLAQRMRLPVCDLQTCATGLVNAVNGYYRDGNSHNNKIDVTVERIDVRKLVGIPDLKDGSFNSCDRLGVLGVSCHFNPSGNGGVMSFDRTVLRAEEEYFSSPYLEKLRDKKNSELKRLGIQLAPSRTYAKN